ncbi:hypothetical protein ABPG72_007682 [Tetrahymena utriculariae]
MGQKLDKLKPQPTIQETSQNQIPEQFDQTKFKIDQVKQQINESQGQESLFVSKWGFMLDQSFGILLGQLISKQVYLINLKFDLSINNLQQEGVRGLFVNFKNLHKLQLLIINLSENKLLDEGTAEITKGISQCKHLQHLQLDLSFNKIAGEDALFKPLQNLENLIFIDLNFEKNKISQKGLQSITSDLSSVNNLKNLKLKFINNQIQCLEGLFYLSQLKNLKQLELQFQSNQITVESFKKWQSEIKDGFHQLISLELNFRNNVFKDIQTQLFQLSGLAQIKSLKKFSLSIDLYNLNICQEISKLNNIHSLSLQDQKNSLDSSNFFKILSKMENLRIFEIVKNHRQNMANVQFDQPLKTMFKTKRLVLMQQLYCI